MFLRIVLLPLVISLQILLLCATARRAHGAPGHGGLSVEMRAGWTAEQPGGFRRKEVGGREKNAEGDGEQGQEGRE